MDGRSRRTKLLDRNHQTRDCWLCVVATEGAVTEPEYLRTLQEQGVVSKSRVKIEILSPVENQSSPQHLIDRLGEFKNRCRFNDDDQFWLVMDIDHHLDASHCQGFHQTVKEAQEQGFHLAISNPCFEVWLLLHFKTPEETSCIAEENKKKLKAELRALRNTRGERTYTAILYSQDGMNRAIERAQSLDVDPKSPWPQKTGSRLYKLVQALPRP